MKPPILLVFPTDRCKRNTPGIRESGLLKKIVLSKIPADTILVCGAPIEDHRKGKDGGDETYGLYS